MIPKTIKICELQLITPCFCAGADQTEPELRAASFRGELRWWFRCLGGTREQESAVFGSVHSSLRASSVAVIVSNVKSTPDFRWSFKKANSRTDAWLPPGQKFSLELRQLREIDEDSKNLLLLAWDCLCNLGAIGARKTRALGAYAPVNSNEQIAEKLVRDDRVNQHFLVKLLDKKEYGNFRNPESTTEILTKSAQILKGYREDYHIHPAPNKSNSAETKEYYGPSVFGNAIGERQSSAVRFRPVLINDKMYLCILKAPDITLSRNARKHNLYKL